MLKLKKSVVYPGHGIGVIEKVENREILGSKQKYYIVYMEEKKMKVMIPVDKAEEFGLRLVIAPKTLNKIFSIFHSKKRSRIDKDWKIRYQSFLARARSGDYRLTAEVVRDLYRRARKDDLSIMEKKLYENTLRLLIAEVALVKKMSREDAEKLVFKKLR
jgi:CarD family transcriptional regulator